MAEGNQRREAVVEVAAEYLLNCCRTAMDRSWFQHARIGRALEGWWVVAPGHPLCGQKLCAADAFGVVASL
jgi:hypothetical protein